MSLEKSLIVGILLAYLVNLDVVSRKAGNLAGVCGS
jgi:hypothetical protein